MGTIAAGTKFVSSAINMPGVQPGDFIVGSYCENLQGCVLTAYVFANDVIKVVIFNGNST